MKIGDKVGKFNNLEIFAIEKFRDKCGKTSSWFLCLCGCGQDIIEVRRKHVQNRAGCLECCAKELSAIQSRSQPHGAASKCWKGVGCISGQLFYDCVRNAKKRDIVFNLTIEDLARLAEQQEGKCFLTGVPLTFYFCNNGSRKDCTASLDRIDSSKPYEIGNVQWVLKEVNMAKQQLSQEQFIEMCKAVAAYNKDYTYEI